jgi:hypothetical protein
VADPAKLVMNWRPGAAEQSPRYTRTMERIKQFVSDAIEYVAKKILLYDVGITLLVALTFLITKGFSFSAYSDRMVYAGITIVVTGGLVVLGSYAAGRDFGVPPVIKRPEEARRYQSHHLDIRKAIENRYDVAIQIWLIGMGCVGISALIQVVWQMFTS